METLASGFNQPGGIAVDGVGNVYVADTGSGAVKEITAVSGFTKVETLVSGLNAPQGVALDQYGNVYITSLSSSAMVLSYQNPPALTFSATDLGSSATEQTVTLLNNGNTPLIIPPPSTGNNPVVPAGFTLDSSAPTACPVLNSSDWSSELAAGESCTLTVAFDPTTSAGSFSGYLQLTDNNLNASSSNYAVASIGLTGTGLTAQTITFPQPASPVSYAVGSIALSATGGGSGNAVLFSVVSGPGTITGSTLTFTGAGAMQVAANQAGSATYAAAPTVTLSIVVSLAPQTISFPAPVSPIAFSSGATVALSATSSSGLPVTISLLSGPGSLSGDTLTITGTGRVWLAANQSGNAGYAAAAQVKQSILVNPAPQTISFTPPATPISYTTTAIPLVATATSGLPVVFTVSSGPGSISGSSLTVTGVGTIVVAANQPGNYEYAPATQALKSIVVTMAAQTITVQPVTGTQYVLGTTTLSATATSGLPVAFASATATVCTVSGSTVSLLTTGTCVIHATQAGNADYSVAPTVSVDITVSLIPQTITFPAITATQYAASTLTLSATASSSLTVSFASATPTVCTVSGTTASLLIAGACILQATQAGNADYAAATLVQQNVVVHLVAQTITFPAIAAQVVGATVTLGATASSGLAVTYTSVTTAVCTVSGSTATMVSAGACVIHATQAGNATYAAAALVSTDITVKAS